MSGPFGVSMVVISERNPRGGEIVLAASTFLDMNWLDVTPASSYSNCRSDFVKALESFTWGKKLYVDPKKTLVKIVKPTNEIAKSGDFWLAFDQQAEDISRKIIANSGAAPDTPFYKNVKKVNLFEHQLSDPQEADYYSWFGVIYEQLDLWRVTIKNIQSDYS